MDDDFMFFWRSRTRKDNTACMRLEGGTGGNVPLFHIRRKSEGKAKARSPFLRPHAAHVAQPVFGLLHENRSRQCQGSPRYIASVFCL